MRPIMVTDYSRNGWANSAGAKSGARRYCELLEQGAILLLSSAILDLAEEDCRLLCNSTQSAAVKNISYQQKTGRLRGYIGPNREAAGLRPLFSGYADSTRKVVEELLSPYADRLQVDLTSFRPLEESGRRLKMRSRNDLIHIDAFPNRPARDRRILRFFTNVHPSKPRVWKVSGSFEDLADRMARAAGLDRYAKNADRLLPRFHSRTLAILSSLFPIRYRSPYDRFMLEFHDYLKMNAGFQASCASEVIQFPAGSTWIAFTDTVPHAVLSGQYALEQTFFVPIRSMILPHKSPLRLLEAMCHSRLL
jgi:hypothetical protein